MSRNFLIVLVCGLAQWSVAQINYINRAGIAGINHSYPIHMGGGGVSFVDFNGDGWDDLTLGSGPDESLHFYQNQGGNFQKVQLVESEDLIKSVLWVDYNNDGLKDLYVVAFDGYNRLYKNTGNLNLQEVTVSAGLPTAVKRCFGASFADVNRDGWLDLYYAQRRAAGEIEDNQMRLFINNADGTFSDVTDAYQAADAGKTPFCATFFDCDNDKWPDVYIANDKFTINTFLQNSGNGFVDKSISSGTNLEMNAMCVAISDFDKNGFTDLYISNTEEGAALLVNTDGDLFQEASADYGVSFENGIGWGANFLDADNDGWEDLYASGMKEGAEVLSSEFYKNVNGENFAAVSSGFAGDTVVSFNNAIGDFDQDGYPDIAVINWAPHAAQLWSNQGNQSNNWIKVDLEGVYSNMDGVGSSICVFTPDGNSTCRYTTCGIGFLGQNSGQIIFGLGTNESVDSIQVVWPTGHVDVLENPSINNVQLIKEGSTTNNIIAVDDDIEIITALPYLVRPAESIKIFPNPTSEYLYLENGIEENKWINRPYEIISLDGKLFANSKIISSQISIAALPVGNYYLVIKGASQHQMALFSRQ